MRDNELFELCKEVYEKTGWICNTYEDYGDGTPRYTSDYLLEKLPAKVNGVKLWMSKDPDSDNYFAWYWDGYEHSEYGVHSDTLLKALIKLVIALDDAGVKL